VQAAGSICQNHIGSDFLGLLDGVEDHAAGICAVFAAHDLTAHALAPNDQLLHRSRAKGIAGRQNALLSGGVELGGKLSDGGRLAGAVDAHHEHHRGLRPELDGAGGAVQHFQAFRPQFAPHQLWLRQIAFGEGRFDVLEQRVRRLDTHVGSEQDFFDLRGKIGANFLLAHKERAQAAEEAFCFA
jgi:hypothetical protein